MRLLEFSALCIVAMSPATVSAQSQGSAPAFEVISVKPADLSVRGRGMGVFTYPGGRVRATSCSLDYLIEEAFGLQPFQIVGAPRWLHEELFDLEGKPPAASPSSRSNPSNPKLPPNAEQRLMLQAALIDRFQLHFHWEEREGQVYRLAKNGKPLQLTPAKDKDEFPWAGSVAGGGPFSDGIAGINESMGQLAERLSTVLGRLVIDQTGIEGPYDFKARYPYDDVPHDVASAILASAPLLGLKLEAARGPVKTLAIDRVERPSGN